MRKSRLVARLYMQDELLQLDASDGRRGGALFDGSDILEHYLAEASKRAQQYHFHGRGKQTCSFSTK
tara:strand:- start:2115 stop:2315 length:201 start_codon:yes stop_codon:yes gene_type:complete